MSIASPAASSGPPPGWPRPAFDWPYHEPSEATGARACRLETIDNHSLAGFVLDADPAMQNWQVAATSKGPFGWVSLARLARITLTMPLRAAVSSLDQGLARIPVVMHQRDYTLRTAAGQALLQGQTVGHVQSDGGLFLFAAQPGEVALCRVFVPKAANLSCEFGQTAAERASTQWISDPAVLRAALSGNRGRRIPRIGEALVQLGLVTSQQIERALAHQGQRGRLGERLVEQGVLSADELQTALAFKLGYPLVDLKRFPIDPACARKLPFELASRFCAIPVLIEGRQLVVAVDGPARVAELESSNLFPGLTIVPAFAQRDAIVMAISALRSDDAWSQEAPWR